MKAEEMFKKLGWTKKYDEEYKVITYYSNDSYADNINFHINGAYTISIYSFEKIITNELLQAINKQIEELKGSE